MLDAVAQLERPLIKQSSVGVNLAQARPDTPAGDPIGPV